MPASRELASTATVNEERDNLITGSQLSIFNPEFQRSRLGFTSLASDAFSQSGPRYVELPPFALLRLLWLPILTGRMMHRSPLRFSFLVLACLCLAAVSQAQGAKQNVSQNPTAES